ncbi:MAG: thiamine-phosphate synthase [Candidatus Poribacteria bacterium]|nr:MAG: thiamine-phosphate synthase [Candidatus Poribacteria bacterium]
MKPPVPRFLVITDTVLQTRYTHAELARQAIEGGADGIQFRQKEGSGRELYRAALETHRVCQEEEVPLIVNDRLDIAMAVDAEGVHLGQEDLPAEVARRLWGLERLIGVSAHTVPQGQSALHAGADYIGFGPVYATGSKPDARPPTGVEALRRFCQRVPLPVLAIGGVRAEHVSELLDAGAYGVAVISAVCCAEDVVAAARQFVEAFRACGVLLGSPRSG